MNTLISNQSSQNSSRIIEKLFEHAEQTPHKSALFGEDFLGHEIELTFAELANQIKMLSGKLSELTETYQTRCIALKAENSIDWVLIDLTALTLNLPIVPVPMFFSAEQITHILKTSGADLLIGDWLIGDGSDYLNLAEDLSEAKQLTTLSNMPVYLFGNQLASKQIDDNTITAQPSDITHKMVWFEHPVLSATQKITFTSGSTGTPKGVCLSKANLDTVSETLANAIEITPKQHLVLLPLSTLLENITGIYVPMLIGSKTVIVNGKRVGLSGSSQFDANQFAIAMAKYSPNTLVLTPALLLALIRIVKAQPQLAKSLDFVAVGGASVAKEYVEIADQLGIPVYEGYGLSECASVVCLNTPSNRKKGSCGKPLPHISVRFSDENELWVKGNIALGYLDEPFSEVWLATGDLAKMDEDGFVQIYGRKKNLLITSFGRNISPEWIETQVQIYFPTHKILIFGDGQAHLSLLINAEFNESIKEKISLLNKTIPDYAQIKSIISLPNFTKISALFTANGRPKRQEIADWIQIQFSGSDLTRSNLITVDQTVSYYLI